MRSLVRTTLLAGLTGSLAVGAAWAGVGLAPVPVPDLPDPAAQVVAEPGRAASAPSTSPAALGAGQLLVGAAKTSMYPDPTSVEDEYPDAVWEKDPAKCKTTQPAWLQELPESALNALDGVANPGSVWPENPNCIYQGGFGLGPVNPVTDFSTDPGLFVRSMAFSDGGQTLVLTVIDGEGWLWDYKSKCTDCGAKQIADRLAADPQIKTAGRVLTPASHVLHATHAHAAPDFIGGWGFVPNWYMEQITRAIFDTAKQAVLAMEPAVLETGEVEAREHNNERRDTYRAAEEAQLSWLRAVAVDGSAAEPAAPGRSGEAPGSPHPTAAPDGPRVIATLGAYAAHPTSFGTNGNVAHPDWPGVFMQALEEQHPGSVGLHFMTGLGNLTAHDGKVMGGKLAALVPPLGSGRPVDDTTLRVQRTTAISAVTNVPLDALGTIGLFDREFLPTPAAVRTGESETAPCVSTSPQSVELPATAARIGNDIVLTAAPGEVFANYTNTVKEKNPGRITFPLAQANDALGYMPQSFEIHPVGQQALGFVAGGFVFVNYEDSYAVDRCIGDLMLETTLDLLEAVKTTP